VQLDSRDVLPWQGPLILDGTDPILLFGVLPQAGAVRSARMRMQAGLPLIATVGIPDQAPEDQLATDKLPEVLLVAPDGSTTVLTVSARIRGTRTRPTRTTCCSPSTSRRRSRVRTPSLWSAVRRPDSSSVPVSKADRSRASCAPPSPPSMS
jgi:hypothetical protein